MRHPEPFLAAHGYAAAAREPLPADASFRRYIRLRGGPRPALLMDAPPPEDVRPFALLARHLLAAGLSVPAILAEDAAAGFLLIEDFGEQNHARLLDAGADPLPLYEEAAEALAALHGVSPPPGLPVWDAAAMGRATAATFLDWWWPAAFGRAAPEAVRAELDEALHAMLAPFAGARGFVHRDYFPANLMRLPEREGARRTGILDFQDAALGHPAYDLVSLVEDARREVAPAVRRAAIARYFAARPGLDRGQFLAAMAAHGAQRHLRVAALWVRLAVRDGKPAYLRYGPLCWGLLARSLSQPACAPLREFLDRHVPDELRRNPAPEL
ncbi:phosphotransferase [Siccirubricoccus sp. KC 17139]|uniref:Phosphotransferase n=1 Tax=Siccirubricoccus soli TaxID=2899147 RepID=A0ABT1DC73_9PROT|nr:phosphotransferase [Siccirubricoccus soli]MCO6419536.1 phosphotransferase [Siccirubricoccus soli]MCP2685671.1 phosphotransferase [Siccirubricoccus soli]